MSVDVVRDHLKSLDTSKASGPDGIPALLLKECCEEIAPSLCAIFNQSSAAPVFQLNGNLLILHQSTKKTSKNIPCYQLLAKFSNAVFLPDFTII